MKVLYIGNYRDGTGWSNAAINNILAMDSVGIQVVPRAISFTENDKEYPERVKELERSHSSRSSNVDCDVVIQHTLPHLYCYNADYKNIGFLAVESSNFSSTGWSRSINMLDELWVPNEQSKESAINSGVKVPVRVVPHSLAMDSYETTEGEKIRELQNTYTFGFVGEFVERKNVKALLKAFHSEFDVDEPVSVLIKTSKVDMPQIQQYFEAVKKGLKIRNRYKEEIVITGMMDKKDYKSVLSQVNCFVMPSRGEAFCIPGLEAMAMGIPSLYTQGIGMDYCVGQSVPSREEPCFGAVDTLANLDTADSTWNEIDILELRRAMRDMYSKHNTEEEEKIKKLCVSESKKYDHKSIGTMIKEILNDG